MKILNVSINVGKGFVDSSISLEAPCRDGCFIEQYIVPLGTGEFDVGARTLTGCRFPVTLTHLCIPQKKASSESFNHVLRTRLLDENDDVLDVNEVIFE